MEFTYTKNGMTVQYKGLTLYDNIHNTPFDTIIDTGKFTVTIDGVSREDEINDDIREYITQCLVRAISTHNIDNTNNEGLGNKVCNIYYDMIV